MVNLVFKVKFLASGYDFAKLWAAKLAAGRPAYRLARPRTLVRKWLRVL